MKVYTSAYKKLEVNKDFLGLSKIDKTKRVLWESFPLIGNSLKALTTTFKAASPEVGKFKATFKGLNAAMAANPVGAVIAGVAALIAVIKIADNIIDKANDNTEELLEKKASTSKNISDIKGEIDTVDSKISELNKQKLSITDSHDLSVLNSQIELLQQRKELLEWKEQNERKANEENAKGIIESTKSNSVYTGAAYSDTYAGKMSKGESFWLSASEGFTNANSAQTSYIEFPQYSAESYVDTLSGRISSIHPDELENVVSNLNDIYKTYDEIVQDNNLMGTDVYATAVDKQKQINSLLQEMQYLQATRNDLDEDFIDDSKIYGGIGYTKYNEGLSSLIQQIYSNGAITVSDVQSQFGSNTSILEEGLQKQGRTLEDYVVWLNAAAAGQEKVFNSYNGNNNSSDSFISYKKTLNEYKSILEEIQNKEIDLSKTTFGNIDTNNRKLLEWNGLNLSKFKEELSSWNEGISWQEIESEFKNSTSTIYGAVSEYDGIQVAFSPILQTESGAELLSKTTVDKYISQIFENAGDDRTLDNILKLDSTGLNIDGKTIKGLIADIGDAAVETSEKMHYLGNTGALGLLKSDLDKIIDSMSTIDIAVETEGFSQLNSAIKEAYGATGLTSESIANLKTRFGELSEYDNDRLFDNTSNGIKINRAELAKLEETQEKYNKSRIDTKLDALKEKYNLLTSEMDSCSDKSSVTYLSLVDQRNAVVDDINATSELAAQYSGLTSEYQRWIDAQSNGEEGDMYDSIVGGFEKAKELFDKGLVGTEQFRTYVDLLSGKDLSTASVDQVVAAYEELRNTIEGTSYSTTDFLKDDSSGIENALNALNQLNSDWANEKDGEWNLNIPIEDAAKKLGVSAEFLESILSKASDYGLTVNYDDVDFAIEKIENLDEVSQKAAKSLKENNLTDIDFNFSTTNLDSIDNQLVEINSIIDNLKDEDGKLNLDSEDVKNAELVLFSLLKRKAELNQPAIMKVDVSQPSNDIEEAVKKIQDLQSAIDELSALNELHSNGFNVDTSDAEEKIKQLVGEINSLPEETRKSLNLNTDEAVSALTNLNNTDITAGVHLNSADITNIENSISGITPVMIVDAGVDSTKVSEYQNSEHNTSGKVTFDVNKMQSNINIYKWKPPTKYGKIIYSASGAQESNGTISGSQKLNGTIGKLGSAKANGDWGAKNTETALMGEIAPEIWVHSDTGKWELVNYPQFRKVKKGDIIFNGHQTKELLSMGSTDAFGDAFIGGTSYSGKVNGGGKLHGNSSSKTSDNKSSARSRSSSSSASSNDDKEPEAFDWIKIAIDRIERTIDRLKKTAESTYKTLKTKLGATADEITRVNQEIALQQQAYNRYMQEANSVGLNAGLAENVRNGTIDISQYDEDTRNLISDYQKWFEAAIDCEEAIDDLHESLASLYEDNFNNVKDDFENQLKLAEHLTKQYETGIDMLEARGYLESTKYYAALQDATKGEISILNKELAGLEQAFSNAMNSSEIEKYSEAWYSMQAEINGVKEEIAEANVELAEYAKTMREIEWGYFDYTQERISQITEEADFLIDLLSNSDLHTDKGQLTDEGMSTMGLYAQNYNVYMAQADAYAEEILNIDKELAKDPYNTELIERREELLGLQQDSILAAEDEKQSIVSLVEEGIALELQAMQDLIDEYTDALDSAKDLYEYQKKIKEQTENISSLRKQLSAYENDLSEETRAKVQKLTVELAKSEEELAEAEYEQYISDQKKLLDELYLEYETILNQRLDNVDALIGDMITAVNDNTSLINETLTTTADSVGYTMTQNMQNIWNGATGALDGTISKYGDDFSTKFTSVQAVLSSIQANTAAMVEQSNKVANGTVDNTKNTATPPPSATPSKPATSVPTTLASTEKAITVGGKINAKGAKIYDYAGDTSGENQYFGSDPIYKVLDEKNGYLKVRYHKLSSGVTGWFKKSDVKAYKTGGLVDYTGIAKVDGTPGKPELMLNAEDTENFLELRDLLRLLSSQSLTVGCSYGFGSPTLNGVTDISRVLSSLCSTSGGNMGTTIGDIEINIPIEKVDDYNDFVTKLRNDSKFENMLLDVTIGRLAGGSSLAKNKYKW